MSAPVIQFLPYQRAWIDDQSRFKIGMFARQTGKTFSTGGECTDDCFRGWAEDRKVRWVILSRGERQAKEAMDEGVKPLTKAFFSIYNMVSKPPDVVESEWRSEVSGASYRALEVTFDGGQIATSSIFSFQNGRHAPTGAASRFLARGTTRKPADGGTN